METNLKKNIFLTLAFTLVAFGSYNALVINAGSQIDSSRVRFTKRLDETLGVITPGRSVAGRTWKKLKKKTQTPSEVVLESKPEPEEKTGPAEAAVKGELELTLKEVINPKKWAKGLAFGQFDGNLRTRDGVIEELTATFPEGEELSVSFAELSGNVFESASGREAVSGLLYQVDKQTFMVTISSGSLEGTRLRFGHSDPGSQLGSKSHEFQEVSFNF